MAIDIFEKRRNIQQAQGRPNPEPVRYEIYAPLFYRALFPFAFHRRTDKSAADKQQNNTKRNAAVLAGPRRFCFVRQFCRYGKRLCNFICCRGVGVIFITAAAMPIFGVAFDFLCCRLCVYML